MEGNNGESGVYGGSNFRYYGIPDITAFRGSKRNKQLIGNALERNESATLDGFRFNLHPKFSKIRSCLLIVIHLQYYGRSNLI